MTVVKKAVKKLSLRPYHGTIHACASLREFRAEYERITKRLYPYDDDCQDGGRYIKLESGDGVVLWLVWGSSFERVVHELAHVLLQTFGRIGHNPTDGDGEPFCYMLSALMDEIKLSD